jgi:hypothetical protein
MFKTKADVDEYAKRLLGKSKSDEEVSQAIYNKTQYCLF